MTGSHPVGDHDLFIGRVDELHNEEHHPQPLLYYRRRYLKRRPGGDAPGRGTAGGLTGVETVRANGLDIGYEVHGAGPPLVMLHGATSSGREDFAAQVPLFSKAFQVFLPDARGHATTRWDATDGWTYADLVDDLAAFADAVGLSTFHLLGFSMGAMTALQFAVRWPDRLRTMIVAGITTQREPRASVARRLMDPDWIDRNEPPSRGDAGQAPRSRPGRRRLAQPAPGDLPRHRGPAAADPARPAPDRAPGDGLPSATATCSSRSITPGDWRVSCRTRGCWSRPTVRTRSCRVGRPCSTRPARSSSARPRRSPAVGAVARGNRSLDRRSTDDPIDGIEGGSS